MFLLPVLRRLHAVIELHLGEYSNNNSWALPKAAKWPWRDNNRRAVESVRASDKWSEMARGSCMHSTKAKATTVLAPNSKAELLTLVEITWLVCIIFLSHLHKSKVKLLIIYCWLWLYAIFKKNVRIKVSTIVQICYVVYSKLYYALLDLKNGCEFCMF